MLTSIEEYNASEERWIYYADLSVKRSGLKAVVLEDRIYCIGGFDGLTRLKSVDCFMPGTSRGLRCRVADMNHGRSNFSVSVVEGRILVSGAHTNNSSNQKQVSCSL